MFDGSKIAYVISEDDSEIVISMTQKCSNNMCRFCNINKIDNCKIKTLEEINIDSDREEGSNGIENCKRVNRIYIINDNKTFIPSEDLKNILIMASEKFPKCKEIVLCTEPLYIVGKTKDELIEFKKLGINTINFAIETGSERILLNLKKNILQSEIIEAGRKIKEIGINLSICIIRGVGGKDRWIEHAIESANVINSLDPYMVRILAFNYERNSEISKEIANGSFVKLSPKLTIMETKKIVEHLNVTNCIFICDKHSDKAAVSGILPYDKQSILNKLEEFFTKSYLVK